MYTSVPMVKFLGVGLCAMAVQARYENIIMYINSNIDFLHSLDIRTIYNEQSEKDNCTLYTIYAFQ